MEKQISEFYPQFKDCYFIVDNGEVYNKNTGRKLKPKLEKDGYIRISLMKKEGGTTYIQLHRALMMAFKPVENMENLQVNHIDGNKQNNSFENLEWCTPKENLQHAIDTKLRTFEYIRGERTNLSHYTEEDAKKVVELLKTNLYTDKQISEMTGLPVRSFISKIRRRETWKYLTEDFNGTLGKGERKSFNQKK